MFCSHIVVFHGLDHQLYCSCAILNLVSMPTPKLLNTSWACLPTEEIQDAIHAQSSALTNSIPFLGEGCLVSFNQCTANFKNQHSSAILRQDVVTWTCFAPVFLKSDLGVALKHASSDNQPYTVSQRQ